VLFAFGITLVFVFIFEIMKLRQRTNIADGVISCWFWNYSLSRTL